MIEIEFILSDLHRGRYRSDQIEKNLEKWFKKIFKHLYDYSCPGDLLIKLTRVILIKVKDLNLNRILGPLIGGWVTELLQKSVTAKNHTIYLSIIALFLSFMPSSCKVVKRKAWLNLVKFIDRDAMSRKQSAIILASASKKEVLSDLISELMLTCNTMSPVLIPSSVEIPAPRSADQLMESFMVFPKNAKDINKIDFIVKFISTHIVSYGTADFDIEDFIILVKTSSSMPEVFLKLSGILSCIIDFYSNELIPISKIISLTLCELAKNSNQQVRSRSKQILCTWFNRISSQNGVLAHPSFEDFVREQVKSVEKGSSQADSETLETFRLLQSIAKGFGEFLHEDILNDICLLTVKLLPEYLKCSEPEMKQTLLDLADTIISCRKAPIPLNQIQQILQNYSTSEFTDIQTLTVVTRLNNVCNRLVAPFHPAKIVEFIKIEDDLIESSVIETNSRSKSERNESDHVMPVPVNIQSQLNRIETELTLLRRKNKRKRTKRISIQERESKNTNRTVGNINGTGTENSNDDIENEDDGSSDDDRESQDRENEDLENEDRENEDHEEENKEETDSEVEEPVVKKKKSEPVDDKNDESVGEILDMTSFSTNNDDKKDEGNETLDNLMSLFSEEPA